MPATSFKKQIIKAVYYANGSKKANRHIWSLCFGSNDTLNSRLKNAWTIDTATSESRQKTITQNRWAHDAMQCMSENHVQKISCWLDVLAVIKVCKAGPAKTVRICLSKTLPATSSSTKQLCPKQETWNDYTYVSKPEVA